MFKFFAWVRWFFYEPSLPSKPESEIPQTETVMNITASQLTSIFPQSKSVAAQYAALFNELFPLYDINTKERAAHFLSQVGHESNGFTTLVENLNYSADGLANTWKRYRTGKMILVKGKKRHEPNALALSLHRRPEAIANNTYANRLGNGPENSGDGWKYRGRGLIMITGLDNYTAGEKYSGLPLVKHPELLEVPRTATIVSLEYWKANDLNKLADKTIPKNFYVEEVTQKVNGGQIGFKERFAYFELAMKYL